MDNLDDSENNAKISDSAYSNSCSNSQSRRSHSSKSTHSGSNSSGSSGYGGKPSTSGSSNKLEQVKKDKESKKKKQSQTEVKAVEEPVVVECRPPEPTPITDIPEEEINDVVEAPLPVLALPEKAADNMDVVLCVMASEHSPNKDEVQIATMQAGTSVTLESTCQVANLDSDGFSVAISMHDGVVMYTNQNLTTNLGFPKDMWIGRSFIDFVHPKDQNTFASQVTNGLAVPKIINVQSPGMRQTGIDSTMVCRIRRFRSLNIGFGVNDRTVAYMPFVLKFAFKDIKDDDGKIIYLIIQATPLHSAFKTPNECVVDATPFVIKHSAAGILEYIDLESVPYLGYLPQDIHNTDALLLYHPDDLPYLRMIYETIVKEGCVEKSLPYRMLAQNGDYVKLETEWSSFINPWSMKLEFVIGKHYIVEGPTIPDVFLSPPPSKPGKTTDEEKIRAQQAETHRENILRILKDVLTKSAEKPKQQMTKRCQDLALVMESLLEEQPKQEEDLRVYIPEPDLNCYERDSVMLGGISPHHDYSDSKSSTETPLSYNQLNYNENLQRFFDSHQNSTFKENNAVGENLLSMRDVKPSCMSPFQVHQAGESNDIGGSSSSAALMFNSFSLPVPHSEYHPPRLTESVLSKHNSEMERELAKMHRESRVGGKGEKSLDTRQKKDHLTRCSASYQPTTAGAVSETQPHGLKRASKPMEDEIAHKHQRQSRRRQAVCAVSNADVTSPTITATAAATPPMWPHQATPTSISSINPFVVGVGMPQQMSLMSHMQGVYPMYYPPAVVPTASHLPTTPSTSTLHSHQHQQEMAPQQYQHMSQISHQPQPLIPQGQLPHQLQHYSSATMPWMYPQQVYGSPYLYPQMPYTVQQQQALLAQTYNHGPSQSLNLLGLTTSNYVQACKSSLPLKPDNSNGQAAWRERRRAETEVTSSSTNMDQGSAGESSSIALNRGSETRIKEDQDLDKRQSTEPVLETSRMSKCPMKKPNVGQSGQNSDETMDRTDGESSYSSFYSSFFKTESGSAEDSSDPKKARNELITKYWTNRERRDEILQAADSTSYGLRPPKKAPQRKVEPPWMEQVCVTSELVYKYQIQPKSKEEVLQADMEKMKNLEQPALVNEQLGQLYLDLQLEGVTTRLTLEEGITSSSSSGEDTCFSAPKTKAPRRKREYSKLNLIYEEDAPMPSPSDGVVSDTEKQGLEEISLPHQDVTPKSPLLQSA